MEQSEACKICGVRPRMGPKSRLCMECDKVRNRNRRREQVRKLKDGEAVARPCFNCGHVRSNPHPTYCDPCQEALRRKSLIRREFGLSLCDYALLRIACNDKCTICDRDLLIGSGGKSFAVDHHHASGVVRGILCSRCNRAIGLLGDDYATIVRTAEYVATAGARTTATLMQRQVYAD